MKNPLLPSRIPVSSKKVSGHRELNNSMRQDSKPLLPPIERITYSLLNGKPIPSSSKRRESSAKFKLRLAEKDQKILETHEYIQVWHSNTCIITVLEMRTMSVSTDESNTF